MIRWREGTVGRERPGWTGVVLVDVDVDGLGSVPALAYPDVVGTPRAGDRVLLNTTALERGLGTGGYAVVVAIPDRPGAWPDPGAADPELPGHLVKARYTPLQTMVLGVDDPEGPHHGTIAAAEDLGGMPVVAADLHSSLPAVLAGIHLDAPQARVVYVMSDGGALPVAYSAGCAGLRRAGALHAVVSVGQAYGGDLEAVTVHTALLAARHVLGADVAVVIQGPGNLGTDTRWGFSGVAAGEALNAAAVLGGRPVAAPRVSQADRRPRHQGLSHHSATAYGRVLAHPADLPVPGPTGTAEVDACLSRVRDQAAALVAAAGHLRLVEVGAAGLAGALADSPVPLSTMGRGLAQDPAAFLAGAAAGRHAASILTCADA